MRAAFEALLNTRYSCRGYLAEPVARATIEKILLLAQRTPSWCNAQPWQVFVTSPRATERLRRALQAPMGADEPSMDIPAPIEYRGVYRERRRECGLQLYESVGVARGDRESSARQAQENFKFFGAPHMALITTDAFLGTYGAVDCGAYVNNFMLAARAFGVASIAQGAIATRSKFLRGWFEIPADRQIVCGISFGYEDPNHAANRFRTSRATVDQTARWIEE
jgi:nitroreductase